MSLRSAGHLLALALPLATLGFNLTAPHPWWLAIACALCLFGVVFVDGVAGPIRSQPREDGAKWPFDALLYALIAVQAVNLVAFGRLIWVSGLWSADAAAAIWLTGASSGYSAIVVGHELVHRHRQRDRLLGRALLATVLYEHFSTEHVRGHHARVATADDPATARHGEPFWRFLLRTVPGQLASAWRIEQRRVARDGLPPLHPGWLRSHVVQGLIVEWSAVGVVALVVSPSVAVALVAQAAWAVVLLEAVNYIEHWGLRRAHKRVDVVDSWDSESWFTYYALVGLSRHADHHAHAARPYTQLRWFEPSPKLPWGYFATVILTLFANPIVTRRLDAELRRKGLGPYRSEEPLAAK